MPWTFAHPAAVLPLRRLCPRWLSWPALVLGAMSPDLSYYIGLHAALRSYCHTVEGVLSLCLPASLLLLAALWRFSRPLTVLLTEPHRRLARAALQQPAHATPRALLTAVLSVLIGAGTHLLWDGLTHADHRGASLWPELNATVLTALDRPLQHTQPLQHLSTLAGSAVLALAYRRACKRQPAAAPQPLDRQRRRWLAGCAGLAALVGLGAAWALTPPDLAGYNYRLLARSVAWATSCGITLYAVASALWWRWHGEA